MGQLMMKHNEKMIKGVWSTACLSVAFTLLLTNVPASAVATDASIEAAAKNSYVFKNYLKNDNIIVESKDGVVLLKGTVTEEPHKTMAGETIHNLEGVKGVDNQLQLKAATIAPAGSDMLISSRVRIAIISHRTLRGVDVRFIVDNGRVTLSGTAENKAQIDLITQYIKDIEGVVEVKNEMEIGEMQSQSGKTLGDKAGDAVTATAHKVDDARHNFGNRANDAVEYIDDASLTALVKATLMVHRSTSALDTKVVTGDGVVTLSGTARNPAARELATQITQDVHGVKTVVNVMGVEVDQ